MIGFSRVVGETVDILGAIVGCTLIFGGLFGPIHARFVMNGPVMFSGMIAPSEFSGQELTPSEEPFQIDDQTHLIER